MVNSKAAEELTIVRAFHGSPEMSQAFALPGAFLICFAPLRENKTGEIDFAQRRKGEAKGAKGILG